MDWSVDLVWRSGGGTRFDSRGAQKSPFLVMSGRHFRGFLHTFWHVGGHLGDTFWSCLGHFFVIFGMSWDVSGSGQGCSLVLESYTEL